MIYIFYYILVGIFFYVLCAWTMAKRPKNFQTRDYNILPFVPIIWPVFFLSIFLEIFKPKK